MDIGYRYKLIGSSDIMSRVFHEVRNAIILAVILIYMVLAAEFESFTQPFVIMMSLPFAVIGAVLGLLAANQTANMMSLIGFTMLLGLVTKMPFSSSTTPTGQEHGACRWKMPYWKPAPSGCAPSS